MSRYAEIAVAGPVKRTFCYRVPDEYGDLHSGQRVVVPFGRIRKVGFYLGPTRPPTGVTIKDVTGVLDKTGYFSTELFDLCRWMADYYFANPADCLSAALPSILKKNCAASYLWTDLAAESVPDHLQALYKKGGRISKTVLAQLATDKTLLTRLLQSSVIIEQWPEESDRRNQNLVGYRAADVAVWNAYFADSKFRPLPFDGTRTRAELQAAGFSDYRIKKCLGTGILEPVTDDTPLALMKFVKPRRDLDTIVLNNEQQEAFENVTTGLDGGFKTYLLHGVTGSGKTIVYCHICREAIKRGRTALVMTPEIALTSTTLAYFRGFFGDRVTVIHSAMTERERLESWRGIRLGHYQIVVGPRSAIFAPLANLGIVIVDEEHDGSYKQDDPAPRFHGRDCAIMRAKLNRIPCLLGSASPSLESYHNATKGRYELLKLTHRPGTATLPTIRVVDMRKDGLKGDLPYLSYTLKKEVEDRLAKNEQVILFLNRRGHSPQLKCGGCGYVPQCEHCHVNLTYHRVGKKLSCHYCGFVLARYDQCPACGSFDFIYQGVGTQKVEENLPRLFKQAVVARLDSDTATGRARAYEILDDFSQRKSNLLLGTQMVTKGLDLPDVTLVGVLSADMSLDLPDFRASEKSFARLLQVAGRSGRAGNPGEVIIQTYYPEHDVITDAASQDYGAFFEREIAARRALGYPPFARLVNFVFSATDEEQLQAVTQSFAEQLRLRLSASGLQVQILGPAPCPLEFLRGRFRRHLFVKTHETVKLVRFLTEWELAEPHFKLPTAVRVNVDVDPDDMM